MYVVRRTFRNYGQMMTPGSVVEPGIIKRFKARLRDRDIVEVSEQDFDKWNNYFLAKFGVPIVKPDEVKADEVKPDEVKPDEVKPDETAAKPEKTVTVKPVAVKVIHK